jgi:hypothetical protein
MSRTISVIEEREPCQDRPIAARQVRGAFQCYCGLSFPERDLLDEHLRSTHPDKIVFCSDCGRVLPKGQWRVDSEGTFYPEIQEGFDDEMIGA